MHAYRLLLPVVASFALAACGGSDAPVEEAAELDTAAQLEAIYAEYNEEALKMSPISATFRGDARYNDQWGIDTLSDEYLEANYAMHKGFYDRVTAIDPDGLEMQDRLSYDVFVLARQNAIESHDKGIVKLGQMLPLNQLFSVPSFLAQLGSGSSAQPFATVEDYDNWLARSAGFAPHVDLMISRMREGVEAGVVQPTILMEKTLPQLAAHIVEDHEQSIFWQPITNMPGLIGEEDRERLSEAYRAHITDVLVPAYERLHTYVRDEYMQNTRDSIARTDIPGGDEWYAYLVRQSTTTTLSPEEIHEIGKQEAARLFEEMKTVRDAVGFEGDMQAFFEFLRTDPQFYAETAEDLLKEAAWISKRIDYVMPAFFGRLPRQSYGVVPVPAEIAPNYTTGAYYGAPLGGDVGGAFWVNTHALNQRPLYELPSLTLHEAVPGHHHQIAISAELENVPEFRNGLYFSAFGEGWALYTEKLGIEMGIYRTPYEHFGRLSYEMWRACRLVIDTGIHAKGWSRQQAIDYLADNTALSPGNVRAEVDRYISWPGQALSYKLGEIRIWEMRRNAEEMLGDRFDLREFHDVLLKNGALPIEMLEAVVERYIDEKLTEAE